MRSLLRVLMAVCITCSVILWLPAEERVKAAESQTQSLGQVGVSQQGVGKTQPTDGSTLASLSTEQLRRLLVEELQSKAQVDSPYRTKGRGVGAYVITWLASLNDHADRINGQIRLALQKLPTIIPDVRAALSTLSDDGTITGGVKNALFVVFIIMVGLVGEWLLRTYFLKNYLLLDTLQLPPMYASAKFTASVTRVLPAFIGIVVSATLSYVIFTLICDQTHGAIRYLFLALLMALLLIRSITVCSQLICSPSVLLFRIIPLACPSARKLHISIVVFASYIVSSIIFSVLIKKLGAAQTTVMIIQLAMVSSLLFVTGLLVLLYKKRVQQYILTSAHVTGSPSWAKTQFAAVWHILAFVYLLLLWLLVVDDLTLADRRGSGAFLVSFLVVPLWMVVDRVAQWVVKNSMSSLQIHQSNYAEEEVTDEERERRQKGLALYERIVLGVRVCVSLALLVWVASLWDIHIPYVSRMAPVLFDTLVIMSLALLAWQLVSGWITRKIEESAPEEEEENKDDDEWGGAAARGRSYTLLPMIRKFIGSILVVMVSLTVLSSMGVDIGPLLAGAGVVGLAIGFGAQKLVSDMFSGFFYLFDDAFRVGEYLQAGSVSGKVEAITLRNVMLRHHRGMLQIVPHSDLGPITNFMRGGIVVKFNLDFPYDTDIDKVRKIIKKVGQGMLADEELGPDFIRPVKSQGVREITDSVMTIRVKFTAQPGKHFVIRREAYRRITEALNSKGIHYAHKKVIVDIPQVQTPDGAADPAISQAAGAAAYKAAHGTPSPATVKEEQPSPIDG